MKRGQVRNWFAYARSKFLGHITASTHKQALREAKEKWGGIYSGITVKQDRLNPAGGKSVRLKNFTGTVKVNPNKTVSIRGKAKRKR